MQSVLSDQLNKKKSRRTDNQVPHQRGNKRDDDRSEARVLGPVRVERRLLSRLWGGGRHVGEVIGMTGVRARAKKTRKRQGEGGRSRAD